MRQPKTDAATCDVRNSLPPKGVATKSVIGVIKEGAYADLLLVDGNPLDDLRAVTNANNIRIIMKDWKIYKNTIR